MPRPCRPQRLGTRFLSKILTNPSRKISTGQGQEGEETILVVETGISGIQEGTATVKTQ